ncbi:hypothetical protein GLYMA_04G049400v4 [Glycine max]|uniref:Uncharacterized protein n=1 Tax=Glycine max TaxID=3847 RepID=A0A0R0K408_SOYBN|nr:hypothetical protein GYH30_008968 [Glycine max]KRH61470.1 hypothetical protein GLYMA_04G049400v4 [Glycine max]
MNDLIYIMYNLKLKNTESNDEWITKEGDVIFYEDNVQVEQPLDAFDIDNLILNDNVEDHFSNKEEFEDDGDEDDGEREIDEF